MTSQTPAVLRADAERNRQRIVDAACTLFRVQGLDVPLEEVAREAGVGIATLYRRFPTRHELNAAVYAQKISEYAEVVSGAAAEDDPWRGIEVLVTGLCALQAADAGLRDLLTMDFSEEDTEDALAGQVEIRIEGLFERAHAAGSLRADVDARDLALVLLGNAAVVARVADEHAWRRYAGLLLESFRTRDEPGRLPDPVDRDLLRQAFTR